MTATVQYDGLITAATSDPSCATVSPLNVPATKPPGSAVYLARFTVTPAGTGTCTITLTDKKGERVLVQVEVGGAPRLYVANVDNASITVYPLDATGDASPIATISGPATGLTKPSLPTFDQAGRLYVANRYNDASSGITVYPGDATGDVSPIATIAGASTGLLVSQGTAVDASGRLYVSNFSGGNVTIYAAGATGDAAPIASIGGPSTGMTGPAGLAFDSDGRLYVANGNAILIYAAGASGDATPVGIITGPTRTGWRALRRARRGRPTLRHQHPRGPGREQHHRLCRGGGR